MRIAIVSDIHGNLTALEAVIADLKQQAPDEVLHLGDLCASGARPREIADMIQALGWRGVYGNVDEMLWNQDTLNAVLAAPERAELRRILIEEIGTVVKDLLGEKRVEFLRRFPLKLEAHGMLLCHASPTSPWASPRANDTDEKFLGFYGSTGAETVVFGHIHQPFVKVLPGLTVINTGSVSLSYDGDWRSSYLLVDDGKPVHRRVEYDKEREAALIRESHLPRKEWVAQMLLAGKYMDPF